MRDGTYLTSFSKRRKKSACTEKIEMGNWKFLNKPKAQRDAMMRARDQTRMVQKLLRDDPKMTNTEAVRLATEAVNRKHAARKRQK